MNRLHSNSEIYASQKDFYDPSFHRGSVSIVGAGGIGSPTAMALTRLGVPTIHVYDDDTVEPRNTTNQHYGMEDVGQPKVHALEDQASAIGDTSNILGHTKRVMSDTTLSGDIVVSAVDSMKSRKDIFEAAKWSPSVTHLIDGRLGGELIVLYVIDLANTETVEWYLSDDVMFDDSESESQICTARTIIDVSYAVAAMITRSVRRILNNQDVEKLQMFNLGAMRLDVHM